MGKNKFLDAILKEYHSYQPFINSQKEIFGGGGPEEGKNKIPAIQGFDCSALMETANRLSDKLRNIKQCSNLIGIANDLSNKLKGLLNGSNAPNISDINKGKLILGRVKEKGAVILDIESSNKGHIDDKNNNLKDEDIEIYFQ